MAFSDGLPKPPMLPPIEEKIEQMMNPGGLDTAPPMHTTMNPMSATTGEIVYIRTVTAILMTVCVAMINMAIGAAMGKVGYFAYYAFYVVIVLL